MTSQELLNAMSAYLKEATKGLGALSIAELIVLVETAQRHIMQTLQLSLITTRQLDADTIQTVLDTIKEKKGGQFVFRHGEQDFQPDAEDFKPGDEKKDEQLLKIRMMQAKHNKTDPINFFFSN